MALWKIEYDGSAYVEADSYDEAHEKWLNGEFYYEESGPYEIFQVD